MSVKSNISAWTIDHANFLIKAIQSIPQPILILASVFLLVAFLVSKKLSEFNKPEFPKLSTIIREIGSLMQTISGLLLILVVIYFFIIFLLVLIGFSFYDQFSGYGFLALSAAALTAIWSVLSDSLVGIIMGSLIGVILAIYLKYYQLPEWERGEGLDDVEKIVKCFKKLSNFDPLPYFDYQKGCFVGKNSKGQPIYIPWPKLRETHMQVMGTTGSGKGVVTSLIASQCAMRKEAVVWFDPKSDRFSPKIMAEAAYAAKKDFHFINLNPDQPPQFNLIAGCAHYEIEELLVAGFELKPQGSDADFYRGKDEDAAILAAKIAQKESVSCISELLQICSEVSEITEQENFWRMFKKLASLSVINTSGGIDLESAVIKGDVIYIIGSCDNERVKMLQKMLLVRVMQIIKKRDRSAKNNVVCVVLDEFKYLLSYSALNALGVVRDFDAHFILAHQSLGDLEECPGISSASAYGAVVDNTSIKILYRINDALHAEKMAKLSGMRRTFVESTAKKSEGKQSNSSGWREAQKYFLSPDLITHLPIPSDRANQASVGIIFGIGNAKLLSVGRMNVTWKMPKPVPAMSFKPNEASVLVAEDLI